jgi:hypothetical protein
MVFPRAVAAYHKRNEGSKEKLGITDTNSTTKKKHQKIWLEHLERKSEKCIQNLPCLHSPKDIRIQGHPTNNIKE